MKRTKKPVSLSEQMKQKVARSSVKKPEYDGDTTTMISTGSTLLDLAISGGRIRGGGIPAGILVEIFGPSGSGKTVLLCELAGVIQRQGGQVMFRDPEARLNKQFARIFGLNTNKMNYSNPDTVPEVFKAVREWQNLDKEIKEIKKINRKIRTSKNLPIIHGIFADSLAALSTDTEMDKEEGDKMGMRRAKEFSEECRKTCRILAKENYLMVCSNQIRQTMNEFGPKYKSPGGEAIGFYSSLRLRTSILKKIKVKKTFAGKEVNRITGVTIEVEVFKSSVWKPFRTAPLTILFDYGIDNIRQNLQFIKNYSKSTIYLIGRERLNKSLNESIQIVERNGWEDILRDNVIDLWEHIERKFKSERKSKIR